MPRPRQPGTLENACIRYVADHASLWECDDLTRLPASFTEKLLGEVLKRLEWLGPDFVTHFKRSGFFGVKINHVSYQPWTRLPMKSGEFISDVQKCFAMFLHSAKQLVDLDLRCYEMFMDNFEAIGGVFYLLNGCDVNQLQVLNMETVEFGENTMEMLRSKCPQLRELYLKNCKCVTDDTITILIKKGHDGQCMLQHIKVLDVRGTGISQRGVRYILECIPTIMQLHHPEVIPVALQLLQCGSLTPPLHLEGLSIVSLDEVINSVEHMDNISLDFSAFSKVWTLVLKRYTKAEHLEVFHPLKNLCRLTIWTQPSFEPHIFEPHISTLIQNTGDNLHVLRIGNVRSISFSTIGKACPNLRSFRADYWSVQSECPTNFQNYFQNVETLCLLCMEKKDELQMEEFIPQINPETEQIMLGLISPMKKLQSLMMSNVEMSSTFLFSLLSRNPLIHIEMIELIACGVDMIYDDILSFIGECEELRKLSVGYFSESDSDPYYVDSEFNEEFACLGWDVELTLNKESAPYFPDFEFDDGWN